MKSLSRNCSSAIAWLVFIVACSDLLKADDGRQSTQASTNQSTTQQLNIIFILTDDLGWGDLGVLHQNASERKRKFKTPYLDQMASEGMQLRMHYCPAPVCAPSRSSLITGVHQGHAEIRDNQFDKMLEDNHTLGTVLKSAGYRTVMIGKYGLQGEGTSAQTWPGYPTKRGFDEFFGYVRHRDGHLHYPTGNYPRGASEGHRTPKEVWWNDQEVSSELQKCYTTDLFTARSKHWIIDHQKSKSEQPFFLMLNYDTPHAALQIPTGPYPQGQGLNGGISWIGKAHRMINTADGEIDSWRHPDVVGKGWTEAEERFATMVMRIDSCVGDLLQTLKDLGIAENTIVIFSSDNGPHEESYLTNVPYRASSFQSYGPFDGIKRDVWEGGIRVPTLAWCPKLIPKGQIDNEPSQFHDWLPTLADAAGFTAPARTDGVSLMPRLTGAGNGLPSTIYVEYENNSQTPGYLDFLPVHRMRKRGQMQVIQLGGFKGVRTNIQSHDDDFEIYDLKADPKEATNLAISNDEFQGLQQQMKDSVLRIRIPNNSARRPYDSEPIPGFAELEAETKSDVWKAYHGEFAFVPNVLGLSANEGGTLGDDYLKGAEEMQKEVEKFAVVSQRHGAVSVEHWIQIKESGTYELQFSSPTPSFVRLHACAAIDADFGYQPNSKKSAKLKLGSGWHPIRVTVLTDAQNVGSFELKVSSTDD